MVSIPTEAQSTSGGGVDRSQQGPIVQLLFFLNICVAIR